MFFLTLFAALFAVLLAAATAADTVAVTRVVHDFLSTVMPGIPDGFVQWLSALVLGSPVLVMVFTTEWVGMILLRLSPALAALLAPHWARWKPFILPILAALFASGLFHNPVVGLGAGVLWTGLNSLITGWGGKSTPAGLLKAKGAALLVTSMLAFSLAQPAGAAEVEHYGALSFQRISLSPGVGYRWEKNPGTERAVPYWDLKVGYTVPYLFPDHIKIDGRYGHNVGSTDSNQSFAEARLALVF
jgi:hypothetical protein